jgi:hypothetical protein
VSLHRIQNDPMIPATFSGEGRYSDEFLAAIDLALNIDETRRPQSIGEWRKLLTRGASNRGIVTPPADGGSAPASDPAVQRTARASAGSANVPPAPAADTPVRSTRPRASQRMDEEPESGWPGRLGQAAIAHPFLSLLLLVAALFIAVTLVRRPASQQIQAPPGAAMLSPLWASAFRPFYFLGAPYAPLLIAAWLGAYLGFWSLPAGGVPLKLLHGHEFIFGFAAAIITGIVLTALPSWAGTEEIGGRLMLLVALWLAGRIAFWARPGCRRRCRP